MKKLLIVVIALLVVLVLAGALTVYLRPIAVLSAIKRRDLLKSGFVKEKIETAAGPQTVFMAGHGPTLVFLHGAGDNAGTWKEVAPKFTDKYHVIAVDLAGHGESAPDSGPLKFETMLSGLDGVVSNHAGPVTLVGNSLGAWVAMLYASRHPDRVARVVAVNGGPLRGDRIDLSMLPENREQARKIWDAILDPGSPRIPDFILDDVVRQSHSGAIGRMDRVDLEAQLATEESLHTYPVPVFMIWGQADRLVPWDYATRMGGALPGAQIVALPRCGHIPQAECPLRFTQELERVLTLPTLGSPAPPVKSAAVKEK